MDYATRQTEIDTEIRKKQTSQSRSADTFDVINDALNVVELSNATKQNARSFRRDLVGSKHFNFNNFT